MKSTPARDDRVLLTTRLVAAFVIIILLMAVWVLYLHPDETAQFFAWTIQPRMTPLAMGAGYAMGAYFFLRVLTEKHWHHAAAGFVPITAFTILMALATLIHLDRFNQASTPFWLWTVIYAITPILVPLVWLRNRATDPGASDPRDLTVSPLFRRAVGLIGLAFTLAGCAIFIVPDLAIRIWPWQLTPLTARVLAGWMMLPGLGGVVLSLEARWSGWRIMVESVTVGALFFFIGVARAWSDWKLANPLTILILAALVFGFVVVLLLYFGVETGRRRVTA